MHVVEVATWSEVEKATTVVGTCIRADGGGNWGKAKAAYEEHAGDIRYFLMKDFSHSIGYLGYVRIIRASESPYEKLWVVDFCTPFKFEAISLVKEKLDGQGLLVPDGPGEGKALIRGWPKIRAAYPQVEKYSYHIRHASEANYLVVL